MPIITLASSVEDFVRYLRRSGRSERTVRTYRWALDPLARTLGPDRALGELTERELEDWQDGLQDRDYAPRTLGLAATAVRSWLRWATEKDLITFRVARAVQAQSRKKGRPKPIPLEDLERLRAHFAQLGPAPTLRQLRDRGLFFLLLTSGFRISEALALPRAGWSRAVIRQKGGSDKALVVPPTVIDLVDKYLERRQDTLPWLWITTGTPPGRLGHESAGRIWRFLARDIGIPPFTNHQLRHTCGTEMARAGIPIQVIADHLGHDGLATAMNYVKIVEEQQAQKLQALEVLAAQPDPRLQGPADRTWVRLRGRESRRTRRR